MRAWTFILIYIRLVDTTGGGFFAYSMLTFYLPTKYIHVFHIRMPQREKKYENKQKHVFL